MQWEKQHCGVHQADLDSMLHLMPDIAEIVQTFPDNGEDYVWDVKVHMLMPNQFPCIPNWHYDNVPRVNNKQDFDLVTPNLPMWLWVSGPPLTEFERQDGTRYLITPKNGTDLLRLINTEARFQLTFNGADLSEQPTKKS